MAQSPPRDDSDRELTHQETLNRDKARRAAKAPNRPGELCRADPGAYVPVVDHSRCEGKNDCVEVCPYEVFQVRRIDDADFDALSFFGKLKSRAHRRQTAYTPNAAACQACGLCVVACPEGAITLVPARSVPEPPLDPSDDEPD